jgi:hypothetical protein
MEPTLFLYIDILGFSDLLKRTGQVQELFAILDKAALHRDSNYRAIVFSDTIVAYNIHRNLSGTNKAIELMFLIELTQELFLRLIGRGVFFRAIITEGEFQHTKLTNLEAYYGQALVDTYRAEKGLIITGLLLDKRLRKFNQVFRWRPFSDALDFVYLTHQLTRLTPSAKDLIMGPGCLADPEFPIPGIALTAPGIESMVYPEIVHFREVYDQMNDHPQPEVRAKFLATWNMYCLAYPKLTRSLLDHEFDPEGVARIDWTKAKQSFSEQR